MATRILLVTSSILGEHGQSNALANHLRERAAGRDELAITHRDLAVDSLPHLGLEELSSWQVAADERSAEQQVLAQRSDYLIDELQAHDVLVLAVPMYNFGVPAGFKAYIDNIVRVGRTFGFDRSRQGLPYWPMLTEMRKRLVVLSSRGDYGYEPGERMAHANHVEPHIRTVFGYLGIDDVHGIGAEYDEFGGERLQASLVQAEQGIDALVAALAKNLEEDLVDV